MLVCLILLLLFVLLKADSSCQQGKNNCILCNPISKLCLECEYDVYTPDKNGGCEEAKICILGKNFCNECDEDGKLCTACEDGYFPDKNGGCSYSNNCEVSFKGKCLKCKKNYILNENINICRSLNLEEFRNCEKIRLSDATCEKCMDGYYLNSEDKKCTKIENCKQSIFGKCILCNKGYYLDKKEEKCKEQKENLLYCKEVLEGINCNQCEDNYYFDKDGNCVGSNYCLKRGELGKCKECLTGYFLSNSGGVCTTTENCYTGIKSEGICNKCVSGYYLDYKDGKCKSNQEENDFKNCIFVDGVCIECSLKYFLSDEHKCSSTLHCAEEINGICIECKQNYYLGLDNKCSNIEHCLYSNLLDCTECEDTFYYEKNSKKCKKWDENFENCIYGYENKGCDKCKVDFYLNMTDKLCYDTRLNDSFYKCAKTDNLGEQCASCSKGYNLVTRNHRCTNIQGCIYQENDDKCLECNSYRCLDVKTGLCENNNNKKEKKYYKCKKTNQDSTRCEECLEGNILNEDGFCVDIKRIN